MDVWSALLIACFAFIAGMLTSGAILGSPLGRWLDDVRERRKRIRDAEAELYLDSLRVDDTIGFLPDQTCTLPADDSVRVGDAVAWDDDRGCVVRMGKR